MITTRRIQIVVNEDDITLRKEHYATIYRWRELVRRAANIVVSHKFVQENLKDFIYVKESIQDKFYVKDILNVGDGMSEQNTTYRVLADYFNGAIPSYVMASLNQMVVNSYKESKNDIYAGNASLRSYKNNIPIPFPARAIKQLLFLDDSSTADCTFNLFKIPFKMHFGVDRSNHRKILRECINEKSSYRICSGAIQIIKKKMYLSLSVDVPIEQISFKENNILYAKLGIETPIQATFQQNEFSIGSKEEFLYRRMRIQAKCRELQIACQCSSNKNEVRHKVEALTRYHELEKNYVQTKLHTYSRMLVNIAKKCSCAKIVLVGQKQQEAEVAENPFILRNWSYSSLKTKVEYKAKMLGIEVVED